MRLKGDRPFNHCAVKYSTMPVHFKVFIASVQQTAIIPKHQIATLPFVSINIF